MPNTLKKHNPDFYIELCNYKNEGHIFLRTYYNQTAELTNIGRLIVIPAVLGGIGGKLIAELPALTIIFVKLLAV